MVPFWTVCARTTKEEKFNALSLSEEPTELTHFICTYILFIVITDKGIPMCEEQRCMTNHGKPFPSEQRWRIQDEKPNLESFEILVQPGSFELIELNRAVFNQHLHIKEWYDIWMCARCPRYLVAII